jgi:hypothetical protein
MLWLRRVQAAHSSLKLLRMFYHIYACEAADNVCDDCAGYKLRRQGPRSQVWSYCAQLAVPQISAVALNRTRRHRATFCAARRSAPANGCTSALGTNDLSGGGPRQSHQVCGSDLTNHTRFASLIWPITSDIKIIKISSHFKRGAFLDQET